MDLLFFSVNEIGLFQSFYYYWLDSFFPDFPAPCRKCLSSSVLLSMVFVRFFHIVANISSLFFLLLTSIASYDWPYHRLLIHSLVDGHFSYFQFESIMNSYLHVFVWRSGPGSSGHTQGAKFKEALALRFRKVLTLHFCGPKSECSLNSTACSLCLPYPSLELVERCFYCRTGYNYKLGFQEHRQSLSFSKYDLKTPRAA